MEEILASCETCDCFLPLTVSTDNGLCRRYPPVPYPIVSQSNVIGGAPKAGTGQVTLLPVTPKKGWCGEWRHDKAN